MSDATLPHAGAARYGLLGLPLAFVALPLYVMLPAHYASLGVPLAWLGLVLLGTRLLDAVIDPLLGRWVDADWSPLRARVTVTWSALALGLGFAALFFPPVRGDAALLLWCALALMATFVAFSLASVAHQSWGSRLGGSAAQRSRLVAWREGLGLLGVLLANGVAMQLGMAAATAVLWIGLALGAWALTKAPVPRPRLPLLAALPPSLTLPWRGREFRRLMALFMVNGIASAIPATLVLFFIQDRVQAPGLAPVFLGAYFLVGALGVPVWLTLIKRLGPSKAWAWGMALNVAGFLGVLAVGAGDTWGYLAVCVASGLALGADLTVPGTLLTGVIQRAGHAGQSEGAYAGWWQLATKLNLALAAGLALPALQSLGYGPGARDPQALQALSWAYGGLPSLFKLLALGLWWRLWHRPGLE
ncbi:MAG: MFS transporter [Rubrivivax sp.]|nr:MAG: MFS transporter [Rubrivivax sp.]